VAGSADELRVFGSIYLEFLYGELKAGKRHGSWDWEADERFAEFMVANGDLDKGVLEIIQKVSSGEAMWVVRVQFWRHTWKKSVTNKRLRHLRRLVKMGVVYSQWIGTGEGGNNFIGVNRVKDYRLNC